MDKDRRRAGILSVPHSVVDLEAYRLAKKVYWLSVFYDRDVPFEDVYEAVLVLIERDRDGGDDSETPGSHFTDLTDLLT